MALANRGVCGVVRKFTVVGTGTETTTVDDHSCIKTTIMFRIFLYLSYIPSAGAWSWFPEYSRSTAGLTMVTFAAFTAMRAYALTRCWWLSAFVFLLSGVQFVTNMANHFISLLKLVPRSDRYSRWLSSSIVSTASILHYGGA